MIEIDYSLNETEQEIRRNRKSDEMGIDEKLVLILNGSSRIMKRTSVKKIAWSIRKQYYKMEKWKNGMRRKRKEQE